MQQLIQVGIENKLAPKQEGRTRQKDTGATVTETAEFPFTYSHSCHIHHHADDLYHGPRLLQFTAILLCLFEHQYRFPYNTSFVRCKGDIRETRRIFKKSGICATLIIPCQHFSNHLISLLANRLSCICQMS